MPTAEPSPTAKLYASHLAAQNSFLADQEMMKERDTIFAAAFTDEPKCCPCCHQLVKVYERKINSGMAYALILIARQSECGGTILNPWIHVDRLLVEKKAPTGARGDYHKLRFWGLLEQKPERREDNSLRNGYWRITVQGLKFVANAFTVQARAIIYNGECLGLAGANIGIKDAIGDKFSYAELMGLTPAEIKMPEDLQRGYSNQ